MVSQDESFTIAIVGGGLGGLALAIGLLRQNVNVHIYEAAHAFAEIGAGVAFGPNARRAMALIDERVHEGYETRATANEWPEKKGIYFDFRLGQDLEGRMAHDKIAEVVTEKGITGSSSVHRVYSHIFALSTEIEKSFWYYIDGSEMLLIRFRPISWTNWSNLFPRRIQVSVNVLRKSNNFRRVSVFVSRMALLPRQVPLSAAMALNLVRAKCFLVSITPLLTQYLLASMPIEALFQCLMPSTYLEMNSRVTAKCTWVSMGTFLRFLLKKARQ